MSRAILVPASKTGIFDISLTVVDRKSKRVITEIIAINENDVGKVLRLRLDYRK